MNLTSQKAQKVLFEHPMQLFRLLPPGLNALVLWCPLYYYCRFPITDNSIFFLIFFSCLCLKTLLKFEFICMMRIRTPASNSYGGFNVAIGPSLVDPIRTLIVHRTNEFFYLTPPFFVARSILVIRLVLKCDHSVSLFCGFAELYAYAFQLKHHLVNV